MKRSRLHLMLAAGLGFAALFTSCAPVGQPASEAPSSRSTPTPHTVDVTPSPRAEETGIRASFQPGEGVDGNYLPGETVIVEFNQAMIQPGEPYTFHIHPFTRGTFGWDDGMTRLTFAPDDLLEPGETYSIMLPEDLKSASGELLGRPELLQFQVAPTPRVLGHRPGTSALGPNRKPEIHVVFDRPMEMASVAAQLQVRPAIEYGLEWGDETSMSIVLAEPFAPGQRYQFVIRAGALAQDGMALASDYAWEYAADPLTLRVTGPIKAVPIGQIGLKFNYAVDPDSLSGALEISPPLDFKLKVSEDGKSALLDLEADLQTGVLYEFELNTSLRDRMGDEFNTPATASLPCPPPVADHGPQEIDDGGTRRTIWIEFDRPMDQQSVQSAFSVAPDIPGWFSWEGNKLIYHLLETYDQWTEYGVTLGTTARTADGDRALVEPYQWTFTSTYLPGIASFGEAGEKIQVVDADGRRAVQFGTSESGRVRIFFDLLPLEMRQVVELSAQNPSFNNPKPANIDGELEPVRTWEIVVPSQGYGSLQEMTLPEDVAPGLYLLQMRVGSQVQDHLVLALSSYTLGVKSAGRQLSVWATDIHGDPVPELEIRVYTDDGRHIREDRTDENGLYETTLAAGDQPQLIFGRDESGDITVAGVGSTWGTGYYWWSMPRTIETSDYLAYVYTERPIYRPGQEVNFKAIVRRDYDGVFDLLPFGTPVEVTLLDSRGNALSSDSLRTNSFGSVFGSFTIAEGAALGTYHIQLDVNGETHRGEFKVEDYRKPDIQLSVETGRSVYIDGEKIIVNITARYFHGEPVANAEITLRDYRLGEFYGYWWEETSSNEVEYVWYPGYNRSISGRTDSNGELRLEYPARLPDDYLVWSDWRSNLKWSTWGLEASVDDGSHQEISAFTVVKVYNTDEMLNLDSGGYAHTADDPIQLEASLRTLDEVAVPGRELNLTLSRWIRTSTSYAPYKVEQTGETNANGILSFDLGQLPSGYYRAELAGEDSEGHLIEVQRYFGVYDSEDFSGWYSSNDDFTITADRESYRPYETASIYIESATDGPAWVTIERGSVRRQEVVQLTAPLTQYDFTVLESDAPNIYVTVNTWQPGIARQWGYWYSNIPESELQTATVELEVEPLGKELTLEIETDREVYRPGDEVEVKITVRDSSGDPVPAEISLAVIDEAIFSLSEELNVSIFDAFYGHRAHSVQTYNSMAPWREIWVEGRGGGGGDGGMTPATLRTDFLDTALWYPALRTNSRGEITVTMTLPDNMTQWRLTAKAVTLGHAVGESSQTIRTHQPIMLRPILPRFLTTGDEFTLTTFVYNYSDTVRELPVRLDSNELVILDRLLSQSNRSPCPTCKHRRGESRIRSRSRLTCLRMRCR
ncbi:MAG: MG2 domain-containing protein [Anaerolineales bacterium]